MKEVLKIESLSKSYSTQKGCEKILDGLELTVNENDFICILGPSGCGKSTLLRCIAGFEDFEGSIICNGSSVTKPSAERIMVFQDYNQLFPWKTVEKNIQYPLKLKGIRDKKQLQSISDAYLRKVGLEKYGKYYPHELSGGMKQRVAIAKALALKPQIILMDEPFAALDAITRNSLQKELNRIWSEDKITVIFITHNIQEAITLGTRVLLMNSKGKIVIDDENKIPKPVKPTSEGYAEMWDKFSSALEKEKNISEV
ncbi:MAG: ABC transporter ATP-binding protein [Oscillospiraceae bacterium]|nr:ABC transporter ATP-binding protein [Oscillospiraceae bacterium]